MVNIYPSSLIGAQAYAVQLRRQYGEEETARAFALDDQAPPRTNRRDRRVADSAYETRERPQKPGSAAPEGPKSRTDAVLAGNIGNPTIGEISARSNPPARPLYSSIKREAPNPNAQLRNVRPGTHLDITI
jgi:hypothetical protein